MQEAFAGDAYMDQNRSDMLGTDQPELLQKRLGQNHSSIQSINATARHVSNQGSARMRSRFMSQEALINARSTQSPESDSKAAPVMEKGGSQRNGRNVESAEVLTLFAGLRSQGVNSMQMSQDLVRMDESQEFKEGSIAGAAPLHIAHEYRAEQEY